MDCISRCKIYKLKNELRTLSVTMNNPNYINELLNVLKNITRLTILQTIASGRYSVNNLQQELKKTGHRHSQENISKEYLRPLISVGLATENRNEYYATTFGGRLTELLGCFPELVETLPARSECYEETLLQALISGPKTFKEITAMISPKVTSRILKRLRSAHLIKTPKQRDYIFFLKSKRDPDKENFTCTEQKIYDVLNYEGLPAGRLAKEAGFSMRATYKCLRRLKGKKLVFTRRIPKAYSLTCKGKNLAQVLQHFQELVEDIWVYSEKIMQETALTLEVGGLSKNALLR